MSIHKVTERFDEREAEDTLTGRRYRRYFNLHSDDLNESEYNVVNTVGDPPLMPPKRTRHPKDPQATVRRIRVSPKDGQPTLWLGVVEYETPSPGDPPIPLEPVPWLRPAEIDYTFRTKEVPIEFATDAQGQWTRPILNSARDKFDPGLLDDKPVPMARISRNYEDAPGFINVELVSSYMGAINLSPFMPGNVPPEHAAKITGITARKEMEAKSSPDPDPYVYWSVTVDILFDYELEWLKRIQDKGFYWWDENAKKGEERKRILDGDQQPYNEAQLLDGTGQPLSRTPPIQAVYLDFDIYRVVDFNALGLFDNG